jgi:uncharacterized membrane protein YkvA (DUF1232 family)
MLDCLLQKTQQMNCKALSSWNPTPRYASARMCALRVCWPGGLAMGLKRLGLVWAALRGDLTLLWRALRHPACPGWLKLGTAALGLYLVLPIDLIPDVLPVIGVVDDVLVLGFGIRQMLKRLPSALRSELERMN